MQNKKNNYPLFLKRVFRTMRERDMKRNLPWYLLEPLIVFIIMVIVFSGFSLSKNIPHYPIYLLMGIIMLTLFLRVIRETLALSKRKIIRLRDFKRTELVKGILLFNLIVHAFEVIALLLVILYFDPSLTSKVINYLLILVPYSFFVYVSALFSMYIVLTLPGIEPILRIILRISWFITPIFYMIGTRKDLLIINLANPLYYFISFSRKIVIGFDALPHVETGLIVFIMTSIIIYLIIRKKVNSLPVKDFREIEKIIP